MPELPEVETIRRQLKREAVGARIRRVEIRFGKRLHPSAEGFRQAVEGAAILDVRRRAKMLLIGLDNGQTIVVHLKMTGKLLLRRRSDVPTKHVHVVFDLADGRRIFFDDVRKFGYLKAIPTARVDSEIVGGESFGPEPLEKDFTAERLGACLLKHPARAVKPLLMDQTCVAGIGNIYADEALWRARVRPDRRVKTLTRDELKRLRRGIQDSLELSLKYRGTSADDYVDFYGRQGENQLKLKAYGREGERCERCGGPIKRVRLGGRSAHYCPKCQR
jgi:formamidopyrimidine-DNA glycosylase